MTFHKLSTNNEIILIATIVLCTAISGNDTASMESDTDKTVKDTAVSYQLPYYIKPLHYDAIIRFNYETNDIIGECNITIHIDHQMENIFVKSATFAIFKLVLYSNFTEKIYIPRYSFVNNLNILMIDFTNTPKLLPPGKYNLIMTYMRYINDNKKYFFQSSYSNNELDNMLKATGVDVITARSLFPIVCSIILCRNEENFNATFKISIKHHKNYTALSNMPIKTTDKHDKNVTVTHFDTSPIMSFNRLRVVITTFTSISTATANVTFWGRKNATYYFYLAECVAQYVLHFLKNESNIIRMPKIDYIAFWDNYHNISETEGLIVQREVDIIYDEDLNYTGYKIQIARLITYQIISLWYADVLLLSKTGFITLLATHILHKIVPIYNIMNLFITEIQRESFLFSNFSRFRTLNTLNITEENVLSYPLNYTKSFNIWRILYQIIPANVFWIGTHTYVVQQYNQTNAVNTDDLWNIMQTVLHTYLDNSTIFIVKELLYTWIAANYYPVLHVTRDVDNKSIEFSYLETNNTHQYHPIFVTYTTKLIMNFQEIFSNKSFWLSPFKSERRSEVFEANDLIIVNLQQTGYYRVFYDTVTWLKLAQYMNSTKYAYIHVLNRAQIIDDAFYFLTHRYLSYNLFWNVSAFLSRDTNYVAWYPMLKNFEYITLKVSIENAKYIRKDMEGILSRVLQKLGYNKKQYESDLTQCLREEIIKWACIIGNKECRTVANTQMKIDLVSSENDTQAEYEQWMYCNGLKIATSSMWQKIWQKWISTFDDKFLEYLTCFEDPDIISTYLQLTTEPEYLTRVQRNTTRAHLFLLIIAKHVKHDKISDSVLKKLNTYILSFTSNKQTVKIAILIVVISHQHNIRQLDEVLKFAKTDLKEMRLVDAVQKKIRKRKLEYKKQVDNYGVGLALFL